MKFNDSEELSKRKDVGFFNLTSKSNNFIISAININRYINYDIKYEERSLDFKKKMLKYLSYEMFGNDNFCLYFNFDFCERDSEINATKELLIPYLIEVHIKDTTNESKEYKLSLFAYKIDSCDKSIKFKKVDCNGNDDFVVFRPPELYGQFLIVPKNEEYWKKLQLLEGRR